MHYYTAIAEQFTPKGKVIEVSDFGIGNINDTYLVTTDINEEDPFILHRIDASVFQQPKLIIQNMRASEEDTTA